MDDELGFPFDIQYLENQKLFLDQAEGAPEEVVVWVESRDDVRLWQKVLRDSKSYQYDFRPASMFRGPDGKEANGCGRLIKLWRSGEIQGGRHSIFCLDSDFKYIASLSDEYSGESYEFPDFYWTIVHSKEHMFIHGDVVDDLVSHIAFVPKSKLGQKAFLVHGWISEAIYKPFLKLLYARSRSFESPSSDVQDFNDRFDGILKCLLGKSQGVFEREHCAIWSSFIEQLSQVDAELEGYLSADNAMEGLSRFEQRLSTEGVSASNIYLFYRGHDWYQLCFGIAKSFLDSLYCARISEIRANSKDVARDVREFKNQTPSVGDAFLSVSPNVEGVPFFRRTVDLLRQRYPESN